MEYYHDNDKKETATVTFVAHMIQRDSRERTAFQETSTFEKLGGAWLYKQGKIEEPPGRESPSLAATTESIETAAAESKGNVVEEIPRS